MITVSFIIPVYNAERLVERCLDSIYALGLPEEQFEIICVDDCSSDNSSQVITAYQQRYINILLCNHLRLAWWCQKLYGKRKVQ